MQPRDGQIVLSPTDVTRHVACPHTTTLDLQVAQGRLQPPADGVDDQLQLVFSQGMAHEQRYREALADRGLRVVDIPERAPGTAEGSGRPLTFAEREDLTLTAMREGADVIYQGVLFDRSWLGIADFLLKVDRPSDLGDWSYDIADTKLARRLKVPALLQMAGYAARLEQLQGVAPQRLVVVTGDGAEHPWRLEDVDAYATRVRDDLETTITDAAELPPTEPVPCAFCDQCRWKPRCSAEWEAADDLSLVAGMRPDHRAALIAAGTTTAAALARAADEDLASLTAATGQRLRAQARLQVQERETGEPAYELLPAQPGKGLQLLPVPDEGDVYLDFEGDPFAADGAGREYLAGVWTRDEQFLSWWAHDADHEREMVGALLTWLNERWQQFPDMHVYHYANYEQAALKRLTGRYAVAETELDMLLRGERFIDLYAVVRQGLRISKGSYSIKKVEAFYWGHTREKGEAEEVSDALDSVVKYERWLADGRTDASILEEIRRYNEEDVRSTWALHEWLEERRTELAQQAEGDLARPVGKEQTEAKDSELTQQENDLAGRLGDAGHDLLAGCVGWHRREDKAEWWEYYRTPLLSDQEVLEDASLIGGLGEPVEVGAEKQSLVWRYIFPKQEAKISVGDKVHDIDLEPGTGNRPMAGTVHAVDTEQGWLEVRLHKGKPPRRARGFGPGGPIAAGVLRESLLRTGEGVLAGEESLAAAVLERRVPADLAVRAGETATDALVRVGRSLSGEVLAVQGPPGAGKTFGGARLVRELLDAGLRVGVTALSHAVIGHFLEGVDRPAVRKLSKAAAASEEPGGQIRPTSDNAVLLEALGPGGERLVGGTAWVWAHPDMADSVDVLVIDEAGQFSLPMALSVAPAARSMVLLGDPQQLTMPSSAQHPEGVGVSVLEHLLAGHETITSDQGIFLDRTYRMHPEITDFVSGMSYDNRLDSVPGLELQEVHDVPGLSGSGIRWVPVEHEGFGSDNEIEARIVADLAERLLRGTWTDNTGGRAPIGPEDILVVAPYNAQVDLLRSVLPEGVRAGTVDRFQGRQGVVVLYSMASSSAVDAPRGVNFLYDTHRFNVAVSRAKSLSVVVGSPALLDAAVNHPEQLRMVNALCRFVDRATWVSQDEAGLGQPALR
ncbi:TM0106 family RecB-like putative nuclease [Ornithinicoccus hortensis]|uniref:AAA+ ATPase domain-containing protein n=1 Tax=Ornithinicoccus hortensis TaxID=82346 RepID=A0A542YQY8_9MICO|nr:TM0106 family RecB-like putative nuclease [Ornithinicoccus hortensis]TQL50506.1 uncharacterized protein FB467_1617 [Ornithinicoccus hortensis]